jgi:hypothetical protein
MGREVRKVPPDWEHPKNARGHYIPLHGGPYYSYSKAIEDFKNDVEDIGLEDALEGWDGKPPQRDDYMPDWTEEEATHFMMYEDTSEGTPISPSFATIEELARWLADTGASAFGGSTATYGQWLATCKAGYAISAVGIPGVGIVSGVEAAYMLGKQDD